MVMDRFRRKKPAEATAVTVIQPQRQELEEVGRTGTTVYGGFLDNEEYNEDLRGSKAIETYRKMRADGTVKAMIRILTLPMRAAELQFDPASDSEEDKKIAEACLFAFQNMGGMTWDDFVRQAFDGSFTYGHAVFEPVFVDANERPNIIDWDGQELLAPFKMAPRLQKTIYRWLISRSGALRGIQQLTFESLMDDGEPVESGTSESTFSQGTTGTTRYITIPAEKLFVLAIDQEGANFKGESVLRSAYKHWYYKDNILRMLAVGIERHMVGTPYAITRQGIAPAEQTAVVNALRTLRSHEKAYAVFNESQLASQTNVGMPPVGYLQMPTLGANGKLANDAINYEDRQMVVSILADFLSLGSGIGGNSNVMHRDKTSYFFLALLGYAQNFLDAFGSQTVRKFVDYNFPKAKAYPKPRFLGLETKDLSTLASSVSSLATAGAVTLDAETENYVRDAFGLPLLPKDEAGKSYYPGSEPTTEDDGEAAPSPSNGATTNPDGSPAPGQIPGQQGGRGGEEVQALALNGTQISSLLDLLKQVTDNQIAPETAKALIRAAFPSLAEELINTMVDSAEKFEAEKEEPPPGTIPNNFRPMPQPPAVPPNSKMSELLRVLADRSEDAIELQSTVAERIKGYAQRMADEEDYEEDDFQRDSRSALLVAFNSAFLLGTREMQGRIGVTERRNAARWAQPTANAQAEFLTTFAKDIAGGAMTEEARDARAAMYAGQVWTGYQRGKVTGMPDDARIIWHSEGDGHTCSLCENRDGHTYSEDDLPGFPGEGEFGELCEGGPNCRCYLEMIAPSRNNAEIRILAEVRCPTCDRLEARNINVGAELVCRRGHKFTVEA